MRVSYRETTNSVRMWGWTDYETPAGLTHPATTLYPWRPGRVQPQSQILRPALGGSRVVTREEEDRERGPLWRQITSPNENLRACYQSLHGDWEMTQNAEFLSCGRTLILLLCHVLEVTQVEREDRFKDHLWNKQHRSEEVHVCRQHRDGAKLLYMWSIQFMQHTICHYPSIMAEDTHFRKLTIETRISAGCGACQIFHTTTNNECINSTHCLNRWRLWFLNGQILLLWCTIHLGFLSSLAQYKFLVLHCIHVAYRQ